MGELCPIPDKLQRVGFRFRFSRSPESCLRESPRPASQISAKKRTSRCISDGACNSVRFQIAFGASDYHFRFRFAFPVKDPGAHLRARWVRFRRKRPFRGSANITRNKVQLSATSIASDLYSVILFFRAIPKYSVRITTPDAPDFGQKRPF